MMSTDYFKRGARDPYLSFGVADQGFHGFMDAITQKPVGDRPTLCLSGHTHRSIEYVVKKSAGQTLYFHDYYIDNTIHGESGVPAYPQPLSPIQDSGQAVAEWWKERSPLLVQTLSLGTIPPEPPDSAGVPGILLITVKDDAILRMERIGLTEMEKVISEEAEDAAWYPLLSS